MKVAVNNVEASPSSNADGDAQRPGLAVAAVVAVTVLTFVCGIPGWVSFLAIPLSLFAYAVAALTILLWVLFLGVRRRPRKAASVLLALLAPVALWTPIAWTADYMHLALTVGFGLGTIGPTPKDGGAFVVYDWSTGLAGGPVTFLIYDMTDEIALPPLAQKRPLALQNGFGEECRGKSRRLLRHYYVCTF